MPGNAIFISYRRADSDGYASRLRDHLVPAFPNREIFIDVRIPPAARWRDVIDQALRSSGAVLAVIGSRWLEPRLQDPEDTLRQELEMAFALRIPIVPVLIGIATMPTANQLPESIRGLASLQAIRVTEEGWQDDVRRLHGALRQVLPGAQIRRPAPPPPPEPPSLIVRLAVATAVLLVAVGLVAGGIWLFLNFVGPAADISISPDTGPPGTSINVSGTGFPPNANVEVTFFQSAVHQSAASDGSFHVTVKVPPNMAPTIWPVDASSGMAHARQMFTVTR